jgi:hypothetical protein
MKKAEIIEGLRALAGTGKLTLLEVKLLMDAIAKLETQP